MSNDEIIARGQEAARLLRSDVLRAAKESARASIIESWLLTGDRDAQLACWAQMHALDAITKELRIFADDAAALGADLPTTQYPE